MTAITVRGHLAAIRNLHIINGQGFKAGEDPRIPLLLKAIAKKKDRGSDEREGLTPDDLASIRRGTDRSSWEGAVFWAMTSIGFHGLLRVGEMATSKQGESPRIRGSDVEWTATGATLTVQNAKTDKRETGQAVTITYTNDDNCPMGALRAFWARRQSLGGGKALFTREDGTAIDGSWYRQRLEETCNRMGITKNIKGHSLRIGGASTAARNGVSEEGIKRLGRWKSGSFRRYIRPSQADLAALAARLGGPKK